MSAGPGPPTTPTVGATWSAMRRVLGSHASPPPQPAPTNRTKLLPVSATYTFPLPGTHVSPLGALNWTPLPPATTVALPPLDTRRTTWESSTQRAPLPSTTQSTGALSPETATVDTFPLAASIRRTLFAPRSMTMTAPSGATHTPAASTTHAAEAGPPSPESTAAPQPMMLRMTPVAKSTTRTPPVQDTYSDRSSGSNAIPVGDRPASAEGPPSPDGPAVPAPATRLMTPARVTRRIRNRSAMYTVPATSTARDVGVSSCARVAVPPSEENPATPVPARVRTMPADGTANRTRWYVASA
jgi:hypothetical protein